MTPEEKAAFKLLQEQVTDLLAEKQQKELQQLKEPLDNVSVEILKRQLGL